jgi:proteasome lid subunit RPN8/RPN11
MHYESAFNRVKEAEQKGQCILGWYHSHPKFEVNPSHIDVYNHEMYQKMFNEEEKPFLGLIISPFYSTADTLPHYNSLPKIRCFVN